MSSTGALTRTVQPIRFRAKPDMSAGGAPELLQAPQPGRWRVGLKVGDILHTEPPHCS